MLIISLANDIALIILLFALFLLAFLIFAIFIHGSIFEFFSLKFPIH